MKPCVATLLPNDDKISLLVGKGEAPQVTPLHFVRDFPQIIGKLRGTPTLEENFSRVRLVATCEAEGFILARKIEIFLYLILILLPMLEKAERFFRVYSGVPIEERKVPIVVVDDQPINWNLAYEEIDNETGRGEKILKILVELEII